MSLSLTPRRHIQERISLCTKQYLRTIKKYPSHLFLWRKCKKRSNISVLFSFCMNSQKTPKAFLTSPIEGYNKKSHHRHDRLEASIISPKYRENVCHSGNWKPETDFQFFTSQPAIWLLTLTLLYATKRMQHIATKKLVMWLNK